MGGNGESWSVSVYIIGGKLTDGFAGDEDPVPVDGNGTLCMIMSYT